MLNFPFSLNVSEYHKYYISHLLKLELEKETPVCNLCTTVISQCALSSGPGKIFSFLKINEKKKSYINVKHNTF